MFPYVVIDSSVYCVSGVCVRAFGAETGAVGQRLVFHMKRDPTNELQPINASSVDAAESSEDRAAHGSSRAGASSSDYHRPTVI